MSAPQDTYTNDIEVIVCTLADRLNAEHRNLANELSGEFQAFFVDICLKGRPAHDAAARLDTAQTLPRPSFQKILSALKQVVIAHDAVIHVLHAIWDYAHVPEKTFKQVVSGTCSYVPAHVVSRYLLLVMPRRIRQPVVSKRKAVIGRSSFGHSVMGESYLRLMTPHPTPAFPDSAEMELLHVLPVVSLDSSSASPSASPSANSVSPLPDLSTSLTPRTAAESGTPLCTTTAHLLDRISSTLCTILPGERSQRTHIPSSSIPGSSALKENVAAIDVDAEQPDSRKRKFWFSLGRHLEEKKSQ
ncbi:hypothetical protein CPB85DRAFT_1559020 [Mucidula mucida]|nr:hypothetical protein CPB85DRAFT_1559020 [Mucidula mucida]